MTLFRCYNKKVRSLEYGTNMEQDSIVTVV